MKRRFLTRGRLWMALFSVFVLWALVVARLVQIQVFAHGRAERIVARQTQSRVLLPADRGRLLDRMGRLLVTNRPCTSFAAAPSRWESKAQRDKASWRLAQITGTPAKAWKADLARYTEFMWIDRNVPATVAKRLRAWGDPAILELTEPTRLYPLGDVGRWLLGRVDIDNTGVSCLEAALNTLLADHPAVALVRMDARRDVIIDPLPASRARDGNDVLLTIDRQWQEIAEQELRRTVKACNARAGGVILMTPEGALRAVAYCDSGRVPDEELYMRCPPITDQFEPGSIFKAVTGAILLATGRVKRNDSVYADSGRAVFNGRVIRDSEPHLWLTFDSSLVVSSNIAFGKWAQRLAGPKWYRWCRDFGFGTFTRVGLPAEPPGILLEHAKWTELAKAQLAMGHSVSVTPLQMVAAFASLANGGDLYRPYLVEAVVSPSGDTLETVGPQKIRHLLPPGVVQDMGKLLVRVVTEGTAKPAHSEVIAIAGKTGTAQKVRPQGGYYNSKFMSSFVGYFPADAPQVVGIVYLDEPKPVYYGGYTAAPAFTRIAERLAVQHPEFLRYPGEHERLAPPKDRPDPLVTRGQVPDLVGLPLSRAVACAARAGFDVEVRGTGSVWRQRPAPGSGLKPGAQLILDARDVTDSEGRRS